MSKETTKIVGAILFALLVVLSIRLIGNGLFETKETAPPAEQAKEEAPAPTEAAPAEKPLEEAAAPAEKPAEEAAAPAPEAAPAEKPAEKPMEAAAPAPEAAPAPAAKEAPTETAAAEAGDAAGGEKVFKAHLCFGCHRLQPGENAVGPSLGDVYGRKAGTEAGYSYSDALKNSGIVWDAKTLDEWVQDPKKMVAGTKMVLVKPVTDAKDRADLIAFLKEHSKQ
jgi:cytochrome c2